MNRHDRCAIVIRTRRSIAGPLGRDEADTSRGLAEVGAPGRVTTIRAQALPGAARPASAEVTYRNRATHRRRRAHEYFDRKRRDVSGRCSGRKIVERARRVEISAWMTLSSSVASRWTSAGPDRTPHPLRAEGGCRSKQCSICVENAPRVPLTPVIDVDQERKRRPPGRSRRVAWRRVPVVTEAGGHEDDAADERVRAHIVDRQRAIGAVVAIERQREL